MGFNEFMLLLGESLCRSQDGNQFAANWIPGCEYLVFNSAYQAVCLKTDKFTGELVFDQYPRLHGIFLGSPLFTEAACGGLHHNEFFFLKRAFQLALV